MKIASKLANSQQNIYGASPVTIVVLGDSVSQGCFELFESGQAIDTVFEHRNAYSTKMDEMLHFAVSQGTYPHCQQRNQR